MSQIDKIVALAEAWAGYPQPMAPRDVSTELMSVSGPETSQEVLAHERLAVIERREWYRDVAIGGIKRLKFRAEEIAGAPFPERPLTTLAKTSSHYDSFMEIDMQHAYLRKQYRKQVPTWLRSLGNGIVHMTFDDVPNRTISVEDANLLRGSMSAPNTPEDLQ